MDVEATTVVRQAEVGAAKMMIDHPFSPGGAGATL
jgi:hypothetical protein